MEIERGLARLKPESWNSIFISHTGGRGYLDHHPVPSQEHYEGTGWEMGCLGLELCSEMGYWCHDSPSGIMIVQNYTLILKNFCIHISLSFNCIFHDLWKSPQIANDFVRMSEQ